MASESELYCVNCGFIPGNQHGDCELCGLQLVRLKAQQQPVTGIEKWLNEQEASA